METPRISLIIPYYKGERFILETLDSVFAQQYPNLEIIIVNDGSPTDSLNVLKSLKGKVTSISQENKGQSAARNTGIRHATGSIIALLDQDDIWTNNHLSLLLPHLTTTDEYDFVRGMTQKFRIGADGVKEMGVPYFFEELIGASLYRSSVFQKAGLFDETMLEGEDADWAVRLRESGCREKRIPDVTFLYRRHETNRSKDTDFIKNGQFLTIKKKLARARAKQS